MDTFHRSEYYDIINQSDVRTVRTPNSTVRTLASTSRDWRTSEDEDHRDHEKDGDVDVEA